MYYDFLVKELDKYNKKIMRQSNIIKYPAQKAYLSSLIMWLL